MRDITGSTEIKVAGTGHRQDVIARISGAKNNAGHNDHILAALRPEPANPHDPNAIAVHITPTEKQPAELVGYIPADIAAQLHLNTDVACRATIVGGWDRGGSDTGSYGVRLHLDLDGASEGKPGFARRHWKVIAAIVGALTILGALTDTADAAVRSAL